MKEKESGQASMAQKKYILLVLAGVAVVIVLLLIVIVLLLNRGRGKEEEPKRNVVVTQDNAEAVIAEMTEEEYVAPGYYSTAMTTTWHFETGDAVSEDAYVANRIENTNNVYFDVFLADDETEPILQSPVIPRGSEMDNISLDKPLGAGTYDCVTVYHLIDEEQNTVSTLRIGLTIVIEK